MTVMNSQPTNNTIKEQPKLNHEKNINFFSMTGSNSEKLQMAFQLSSFTALMPYYNYLVLVARYVIPKITPKSSVKIFPKNIGNEGVW